MNQRQELDGVVAGGEAAAVMRRYFHKENGTGKIARRVHAPMGQFENDAAVAVIPGLGA